MCLGSFYDCLSERLITKDRSFRSHCEGCGKELKAIDLIPLISFCLLKGRCRYCGQKISILHPLNELVSGIAHLILYIHIKDRLALIEMSVVLGCILIMSYSDLKIRMINEIFILIGIINRLIFLIILNEPLISLIPGFLFSLLIFFISWICKKILKKECLGFGDIEFIMMAGMYLDLYHNCLALLIACLIALPFTLIKREGIAFIPMLGIGYFLTFLR
jgi:leader peptidase (prepilin peptidase)/N-methyltransferase